MKPTMISAILVAMVLTTIYAILIPPLRTISQSNSTAALSVYDSNVRCNGEVGEHKIVANDCRLAVLYLPKDQPGDVHLDTTIPLYLYPRFTRISPQERHRLPQVRNNSSCGIMVNLASDVSFDHSSWRIIKLRIENVITKCVEKRAGRGGATVTGEEKDIEIVVYGSEGVEVNIGGNENVVTA